MLISELCLTQEFVKWLIYLLFCLAQPSCPETPELAKNQGSVLQLFEGFVGVFLFGFAWVFFPEHLTAVQLLRTA